MQAEQELDVVGRQLALEQWLHARDNAVASARALSDSEINAHKQIVNRLLEPWMWITVICSATSFTNFFHQRTDKNAQPEIKKLADMMVKAYYSSSPVSAHPGAWHLPYIQDDEFSNPAFGLDDLRKLSVARCARVSYLNHTGVRSYIDDMKLHDRLVSSCHWSPFEHVAFAQTANVSYSGNFTGWTQYRKSFIEENVIRYDSTSND